MHQGIDYMKLGLKIKELRKKQGLSQDKLAEIVHCNTTHISNIENNHTKVSLNMLLGIANALNTSIDNILLEQYTNKKTVIDDEILKAISDFDMERKQKLLRIIEIL